MVVVANTVEVVLRHFHRCRYRSSPMWFFFRGVLVSWSLAMVERSGYEDLCGLSHWSVIPYTHGRTGLYCPILPCLSEPEPYLFSADREVASTRAFYSSRLGSYNESRGPTGGLRAGKTLCCRVQRIGVANDVLYGVSSVESSCLIALLH
jgi:hypothetical protein